MNGSIRDLEKIVELSKKFDANIILDEAHATGVIGEKGKGLAVKLNLESEIFARIHTFGKSLGMFLFLNHLSLNVYDKLILKYFSFGNSMSEFPSFPN